MKKIFLGLAIFLVTSQSFAGLKTKIVEYKDGDTVLEGYLAYNTSVKPPRPGILVVHEWNGLGHFAKHRAEQLAKMGYVAFAADIYGKGVRPDTFGGCKNESGKYYKNRALLRKRVTLGLSQLKNNEMVDPGKLAAIGYCFGGETVLDLARSGADVKGVVSFHGGLDSPNTADARNIKGKILVCQGGDDQFTLPALPDFQKEMDDAKVDYRVITYKGAVHGFTNPDNKGDVEGLKYNRDADRGSWKAMRAFFKEIFKD